jgi:foldase protein PrsA
LEKKQLWIIIAGLILINCLTVAFFLTKLEKGLGNNEVVATIGNEEITRQDWLKVMEDQYGKDVLKDLIDQRVIETLAKKYKIEVSDKTIDRELLLMKTMYGSTTSESSNEEEWKNQIKASLLLEELLTKDVKVPEKELKSYYEENKSLFTIPTSYHVSQIVVGTLEEAEQAIKELKNGSNFSTLAMEKSIDEFSAAQGGDIGFIRAEDESVNPNYIDALEALKPGEWSKPIQIENGYAIALLHEKIEGKDYSFNEVKSDIRRLIALEQMEGHSSMDAYWDEVNVEWFYGEQ